MARASNKPSFLSAYEVTRMFELKEAGYQWRVIANSLRRPIETLRKRYYREIRARNARHGFGQPLAIIAHRNVETTAGTMAQREYEVTWVGTDELSWEPFRAVYQWECYSEYNLLLQGLALGNAPSRTIS